jgi:hypothetical protein
MILDFIKNLFRPKSEWETKIITRAEIEGESQEETDKRLEEVGKWLKGGKQGKGEALRSADNNYVTLRRK